MSLEYIPFQPLYFGELPDDCSDCGREITGTCRDVAGIGGVYANLAQYNDVTQFQLALGLCEDSEQLVLNPNFESVEGDQVLNNPEFDGTTANWSTYTDNGVVGFALAPEGAYVSYVGIGVGYLYQNVPEGFYFVEVEIYEMGEGGSISILNYGGDNPTATAAGTLSGTVYAGEYGIALDIVGSIHIISSVKAYPVSMADWDTAGGVVFAEDQIVTIIGDGTGLAGINQSGTLLPNTTYLFEINVISLEGGVGAELSTDAEEVLIQSTGIQQFVLTTGSSPYVRLLSFNSVVSVQYVRAYDWFEPEDITVEIIPYGSTTPIYTLTDGKYIDVASLTVSLDWDAILVEEDYLPEGLYYIKVTDCDGSITSQPIDLATSHSCTFALRACMDNDAFGFDFTAFSPFIRLKAQFSQPEYNNTDRLRFIDTRDRATNAHSVISKVKIFKTDFVPEYVLDFLGTLSGYSNLWMGNSQYSVENPSLRPEINPEFISWGSAELELRMVNHPLRMTRCSSTVKDCSPPPNCWQWNDESNIEWNNPQECILLNN